MSKKVSATINSDNNDSADVDRTNHQSPASRRWRPILTGLVALGVTILTLMAAFVLSLQDLPVAVEPPPPTPVVIQSTPLVPAPTSTPFPLPSPTSLSTAVSPAGPDFMPTPKLTPLLYPTPTPTFTPTATATSRPTRKPPFIPGCVPPAGWVIYTVGHGDTWASLAARYDISIALLMQANCLPNQALYPGQVLYVPPFVQDPTATRPPCGNPPSHWVRYTVQLGDTLLSLSVRTHTSIYDIMRFNCLVDYTLYVGQQLWLPFIPPTLVPTFTLTPTVPPTVTVTPTASPTSGVKTPSPTSTSQPVETATPTQIPSHTPTSTATDVPPTATATESATITSTPTPTSQPPTVTYTPLPPTLTPTLTSQPATPTPPPTNTPVLFVPPTETSS